MCIRDRIITSLRRGFRWGILTFAHIKSKKKAISERIPSVSYTHLDVYKRQDKYIGEKGTPKRDAYEEELNSFLIGEAIKQARKSKNLTQEELGLSLIHI